MRPLLQREIAYEADNPNTDGANLTILNARAVSLTLSNEKPPIMFQFHKVIISLTHNPLILTLASGFTSRYNGTRFLRKYRQARRAVRLNNNPHIRLLTCSQ